MELSRSDFQILNVLKEHQCTNYQESMTLQEIIPELPFSRVTAYKRLKNLCDMGYTAKGCQAEQADTYYIPNTYGNANKYHKKKLEYYQMKKVLLSILEPAHIQKGEVLQRKRTYDYEEGYEDILKSGNYVNNSGFYDPDRKEHVEFVVQMIPETVYYLTYTLSNRTFRVPLEESEIKQYPDLEVVDVGRITPVYGDITADMLSVQFVEKILLLIKNRNYTLIFENNTEQETEVKDELAAEPVSVE